MPIIHNPQLGRRLKARYGQSDIRDLRALLAKSGTLSFEPLTSGLFPAAALDSETASRSGYGKVWVRDNVYVALAHLAAGKVATARAVVEALVTFYRKQSSRFEAIVDGSADPELPMNRPHVRFDGHDLVEIPVQWSHAQNDALGYFLWLYCDLASRGHVAADGEVMALLVFYFRAIRYWQDEDSGHWEERRKTEASSIGAVVAGLQALRTFLAQKTAPVCRLGDRTVTMDVLDRMIERGRQALAAVLPSECMQTDPRKHRRYDAALLFLVYPLDVVDDVMAQRIVDDVLQNLMGQHGIRRYLGDSYWTADYKERYPEEARTSDISQQQDERDALARPGEEAQWCLFDPIVSIIAGRRYLSSGDPGALEQQIEHLNRALGQLTGPDCPRGQLRCPEAYYLEHGRYAPNDHVPLLWTQANLWLGLMAMESSSIRRA